MTTGREFLVGFGLLALVPLPTGGAGTPRAVSWRGGETSGQPSAAVSYSKNAREFYMTSDEIGYIRPGFHITVNSITIPEDRRPVVDYSFKDDLNQPLDRLGQVTPGSLSINQVLAWYDGSTRYYTAYTTRVQTSAPTAPHPNVKATQAAADSGGTWTDVEIGHSIYKFKTVLPENFDQTKTHTLAIYATRNLNDIVGKNYYDNVVHDFRPDGGTVTEFWDKTVNGNCNVCHNPLAAHGGSRQDVKLCVTCHSPQTVDPDTGRSVNFREMIHKIHRGENLPSVQAGTPYVIWGNNSSIHDFSDVVFPKDIRNCETCHKKGDSPEEGGTQYANYFTYPARTPCGACHDNVNFVTGENHAGGPQADDSQCASCHRPQGDREWDASILGAHTIPSESKQLKGLHTDILEVRNSKPGQKPTVVFSITENDGTPVAPSSFTTSSGGSNLYLLMGGPTTDYAVTPIRERADGASFNGTTATYTFTKPIPTDATGTGTWAFSIDARRTVVLDPAPPEGPNFTEGAFNHVHYAAVTDATPVPRRSVVNLDNCNLCHDRLVLHGGQRFNIEECVMCHNPNASDVARRPADKVPVESIDFKRMIHRIHTGEELTAQGDTTDCSPSGTPNAFGCFTIYGFGTPPSVNNFNHVRFPGDRRDCATCHLDGTWEVQENPRPGALPTQTLRDWYTPQQPTAAACLGCHDSQSAAAHAFLNTAPFGEACAVCHGPGAVEDVDKVHAQ
jgi:OmcA/MtrC family decaheme c-type cytochrome